MLIVQSDDKCVANVCIFNIIHGEIANILLGETLRPALESPHYYLIIFWTAMF